MEPFVSIILYFLFIFQNKITAHKTVIDLKYKMITTEKVLV